MIVTSKSLRIDTRWFGTLAPNSLGRRKRRPSRQYCLAVLSVETLETRRLLDTGFLQGTSFVDTNFNDRLDPGEPYLPGAQIRLYADDGTTLIGQQTTDANGAYRFDNLPPAYYRLVQVPPPEYQTTGVEPLSQVYPSSELPNNTLRVQVLSPDGFSAVFDEVNPYRDVSFQVYAIVRPDAPVGQMHVTLNRPDGAGSVQIRTFCVDITVMQWPGGAVVPEPLGPQLATAYGGRIAYLYNHYGTRTDLTDYQAAGLQLALWELQYDTTLNLANGDFRYLGSDPQLVAIATAYLNESAGKSETAIFVRAQVEDHQSFLATGSFNFGSQPLANVVGWKWHDLDGDRTWDGNEVGLTGWTIELLRAGTVVATTQTMADDPGTPENETGKYRFANVVPGTYSVREQVPGDWLRTYPTGDGTHTFTVTPGGTYAGARGVAEPPNFGNFQFMSINGLKFEDRDGDGALEPGEPGLQGWTIQLLRDGQVIATTPTGADGAYSFSGLAPGTYQVREVGQTGWTQTTPNPADITAVSGQNVGGIIFGNFRLTEIAGFKFNDLDGDAVPEPGEPRLAGWTIQLLRGGAVIAATTTDSSGAYRFTDLVPGTYGVREVPQDGWTQTTANPADFAAVSGQNVEGLAFGNFRLTSLSGRKFMDRNGDGVRQEGDFWLAGWTVFLDANANGTLDNGERSTVTDADGAFRFTNLGPGTYLVREVRQERWVQTTSDPAPVVAVSGQEVSGILFGNSPLVPIAGRKFHDLNGNGQEDTGEPGLAGWTIQLDRGADGSIEATTTTDANGAFRFDDLFPGTYRVSEVGQDGWVATVPAAQDVVLLAGGVFPFVTFGNFRLVSISGLKFEDRDGDGTRAADEPGLANWTIFLDGNGNGTLDNGERSTLTAADGTFRFTGLGPGTYLVREVRQEGWLQTTANPAALPAVGGQDVVGVIFGNLGIRVAPEEGEEPPIPVYVCEDIPALLADLGGKGQLMGSALHALEQQSAFVAGLYCNLLQRTPDPQGLTEWVRALQLGASHHDVAQGFWRSAEHRGLEVESFYQTFLDRPADAAGRAAWVNALQAGVSETDVMLAFLVSPEYQARRPGNVQYVSGLYIDVLGRSADLAGGLGWVQTLEQGTDRATAARAFLTSGEFYLRTVDDYYSAFLDRTADSAGRLHWVTELRTGRQDLEGVAEALLASEEYYEHVLRK